MTEHDEDNTPSAHPRRTVLRGALALGAVGIGGALAGCGGSSNSAASSPGSSSPPAPGNTGSAAPSSAATPSATPAAAATASGGGGTSLGAAAKVPVGGGVVFDQLKVVVTQPTAGEYKAFTAICTHQQCIVNDVDGGTINCACHGSKYSITDGSVVRGPAPQPLAAKKVSESGGTLTLG